MVATEHNGSSVGNGIAGETEAPQPTAIVKRGIANAEHGMVLRSFDDMWRFSTAIARVRVPAKNGEMVAMKGAETAELVMMKVAYGAELGLPAMASVVNVYVVDGRPALGATAIAARIRATGTHNFRIKLAPLSPDEVKAGAKRGKPMRTPDGVTLEMLVRVGTDDLRARDVYNDDEWAWQGEFSFTKDDAVRAELTGKDNHRKYPRDMFFHRALTSGARECCPEVFFGSVYTPEELGAIVDDYGDVIEAQVITAPPVTKAPRTRAAQVAEKIGASADTKAPTADPPVASGAAAPSPSTTPAASSAPAAAASDGASSVPVVPATPAAKPIERAAGDLFSTSEKGGAPASVAAPPAAPPSTTGGAPALATVPAGGAHLGDAIDAALSKPPPARAPVDSPSAETIAAFDEILNALNAPKTDKGRILIVRAAAGEAGMAAARKNALSKIEDMTQAEADGALRQLRDFKAKKDAAAASAAALAKT